MLRASAVRSARAVPLALLDHQVNAVLPAAAVCPALTDPLAPKVMKI